MADLGLTGEYARQKFENGEPCHYTPEMAERYLTALLNADRVFKQHRNAIEGDKGPAALAHGFDLDFEWFGTRTVEYEEDGEVAHHSAQLNLGFSPGESSHPEPYFYSNPWAFEGDRLPDESLPSGARWFSDGWQSSILPYNESVDDDRAAGRLLAYASRVYNVSSPTLMA